jgi:hypothetical protein
MESESAGFVNGLLGADSLPADGVFCYGEGEVA